ncbi:low density lipoprotein receptor adapter protein 1-A-like [Euwallacea similis]|uniref:low density lipoprotein receptor adapter protein 1-A-like n=1 Tax=Euwallacea similis TaxID=1736056 RepID=UPI00344ED81F
MSFFKIKPIWKGNSKHKKLSEDSALQNGKEVIIEPENESTEIENDVVTFKLKYLGCTVVEKPTSLTTDKMNISSEAVKKIIKTAKAARKQQKKLQRVIIAISTKGIAVTDLQGNDLFKVSIYRISNCASDSTHRQVFSFISTDQSDVMECHAFFCSKRKLADAVTLTVGKIFTSAYEAWRDTPNAQELLKNQENAGIIESNKENQQKLMDQSSRVISEEKLIDFDCEGIEDDDWEFDVLCSSRNVSSNNQWVSFEDDFARSSVPQVPPQSNLILV